MTPPQGPRAWSVGATWRAVPILLGWATLCLGLVLAWRAREDVSADPRAVQNLLTYPIDAPLRFSLEAGEQTLRLDTWLVNAQGWGSDPRVTAPYCLDVRAEGADGETLFTQRSWLSARAGWHEAEDGRRRPSVEQTGRAGEPSSDRLLSVDLRGRVERGGVLCVEVCAAPKGAEVLAIAFRLGERDRFSRFRIARGLNVDAQRSFARDVGAFEWAAVPARWREELSRTRWERLGALPFEGRPPEPVRLRSSDTHIPWEDVPAWGIPLLAGGAAAFNLDGQAWLEGAWSRLDGTPASAPAASLRLVHADGRVSVTALPPGERIDRITLSEGLVSVQIALSDRSDARLLRVRTGDANATWGAPARLPVEEDGLRRVGVDLRRVEYFRVSADTTPLSWPVVPGESLRLLLRARLDPGPLYGFAPAPVEAKRMVRVTAVDAEARTLAAWEVPIDGIPSSFERYTQQDTIVTARVSEQVSRAVIPPAGAARLLISADGPVDVSLRERDPEATPIPDPAYPLPEDAAVRARYVPDILNPWIVRAPHDFERLSEEMRVVNIDAQVRLEPEGEDGGGAQSRWYTLPLERPFELMAQSLTDRSLTDRSLTGPSTQGGRSGALAGARVRLGPEPVSANVGPDGRLEVDYRVPPEAVGATARLRVGDAELLRPLPAAGGRLTLGPLPPGPVALAIDLDGLFLAPTSGLASWLIRRFYRLDPDLPLNVRWPGGVGRISINVCGVEPGASLSWALDAVGGQSGLHEDFTALRGAAPLSRSGVEALPLSFAATEKACAAPVIIPIRSDVGGGACTLRLTLRGARQAAWVRLASTRPTGNEEEEISFGRRGVL